MALSRRTILATVLLLTSTATNALPQPQPQPEPQGKVDTAMPFLSSTTAAAADAWASTTSTQWWTPSSSATAVATPQSSNAWESTPVIPTGNIAETTAPYSNPFTIYTTQTDSRGVITGMPAVVTAQPSQADVATVCSGCSSVLSDEASWSSMVASLYSTSTPAAAVTGNETLATSTVSETSSASRTGFSQSTGAASRKEVLSGGAMLALFGAVAAAL